MDITASTAHGRVPVTIIHIQGSIDSSSHQTFQAVSETIINDGARHLLIDLKDAYYISSAGLRAIHILFNKLRTIHKDVNDDDLRIQMKAGSYKSPYKKKWQIFHRRPGKPSSSAGLKPTSKPLTISTKRSHLFENSKKQRKTSQQYGWDVLIHEFARIIFRRSLYLPTLLLVRYKNAAKVRPVERELCR